MDNYFIGDVEDVEVTASLPSTVCYGDELTSPVVSQKCLLFKTRNKLLSFALTHIFDILV